MSITYLKGDATCPRASGPKILAHICNNLGGWGRGFVVAVSSRWKEPEKSYRAWYKSGRLKLGLVQYVDAARDLLVANMVAQKGIGMGARDRIHYPSLSLCLKDVQYMARDLRASVHMPRIGTGLGGSSWEYIEPLIQEAFKDSKIDVFVYDL